MVNYRRYFQEGGGGRHSSYPEGGGGGGGRYPIIAQEGGGSSRRRRPSSSRRVAFVTRTGRRVTFAANPTKKRRTRPKQQKKLKRKRGQAGKGFVANYLGNELKDVGGQFARSMVSEGANEAQLLLRKGATFLKNKLMRRRKRIGPSLVPNPVVEEEEAGYLM